ncbi:hypothetical protein HELRODRAFT_175097 [Helobdella robusta]|uniref:SURP motif domain-containing protein n=1 Tax=Helobdella robusta TaxID=6412 RepID=T1F8U4_HELRO|nr:hypothetical protein HELRODRAFT_175097 [Helobdella robusta]ESO01070.1 hypothetical protein HELRODRAFT_175097 [Helobdella robusta]
MHRTSTGWKSMNSPSPNTKDNIDRQADCVARNGPEFEEVVKRRNKKFDFLQPHHRHHAYYVSRKKMFIDKMQETKTAENNKIEIAKYNFTIKSASNLTKPPSWVDDDKNGDERRKLVLLTPPSKSVPENTKICGTKIEMKKVPPPRSPSRSRSSSSSTNTSPSRSRYSSSSRSRSRSSRRKSRHRSRSCTKSRRNSSSRLRSKSQNRARKRSRSRSSEKNGSRKKFKRSSSDKRSPSPKRHRSRSRRSSKTQSRSNRKLKRRSYVPDLGPSYGPLQVVAGQTELEYDRDL